MVEMAGLMSRLLEDPDSDAVVMPQILKLSEALPAGPTKGALESSVEAMNRLRAWLRQLQARQRLNTRFSDITSRLSRIEGLDALMQSLAEEARRMLDAPLARLDAFPPLLLGSQETSVSACSGEFISRLPHVSLRAPDGLAGHAARATAPIVINEILRAPVWNLEAELEQQARIEGLHGLVLVPLLSEGQSCGLLMVADRMARQWTPMDIEALQHLTTVAVRAIGRAARADAAQHALRALHERHRQMRLMQDRRELHPAEVLAPFNPSSVGLADGATPLRGPIARLVESWPPAQRDVYVHEQIGPLLKADLTRGTALALTLLTYMDHGHNARAAARVLGVHVNTLHNRLESIGGLLPGWSLPGRGLEVHLALWLSPDVQRAASRLANAGATGFESAPEA